MADYNLDAPVDQAKSNYSNLQGIFAGQRGETSDYLNRFTGAINAQPTMQALSDRIGGELGLPNLRSNAQSLQQSLYDIPGTYKDATTGFNVNSNQLSRIVGQKQSELAPSVDRAQSQLGNAESQLNQRMGYAQADQAKQLLPYQSEQSLMSDRLARETTGYTQAMGQELDAIIARMNAGVTISEAEKNRAHELAVNEQKFEQQKKLTSDQNRYINVGANGLYDTQNEDYVSGAWS